MEVELLPTVGYFPEGELDVIRNTKASKVESLTILMARESSCGRRAPYCCFSMKIEPLARKGCSLHVL